MTAVPANTAARARPWRGRILIALLAVSLVLNLCFIGGAVWMRMQGPPSGPERVRQMTAELGLTPQQQADYQAYLQATHARTLKLRSEMGPRMAAIWTEMAKPQPDQAQIARLLDESNEARRSFQKEATSATLGFMSTLSPQQREKFVAAARERHASWARQLHRSILP